MPSPNWNRFDGPWAIESSLPPARYRENVDSRPVTDGIGAYEVSYPFIDLLPEPANMPTVPRRPASQQELPDTFSADDIQRLGLNPLLIATKDNATFEASAPHGKPEIFRFLRYPPAHCTATPLHNSNSGQQLREKSPWQPPPPSPACQRNIAAPRAWLSRVPLQPVSPTPGPGQGDPPNASSPASKPRPA